MLIEVERTFDQCYPLFGNVEVSHGGSKGGVTEKLFDGVDIVVSFKKVGSKAVPECVDAAAL